MDAHKVTEERQGEGDVAINMSAYERKARARGAALSRSASEDGAAISAPARAGYWRKFERQVEESEPDLRRRDPAEFHRRVKAASAAFMAPIQAKGVAARRAKAEAKAKACPRCLEERGERPVKRAGQPPLCGRHADAARRAEARKLNKPQAPEAVTLREKVEQLEAEFAHATELLEYLIRREIAEQAGDLTERIMGSITRDMRAITPDELRAADRGHAA